MYKFNFLNKINQEKLEIKKRDRFIKMVFILTTVCLSVVLIIMYLVSLNIKSEFNEVQEAEQRINKKTKEFREKDFFKYKQIENIYNSVKKRKKVSAILNSFAAVLDSNLIINNIVLQDLTVEIEFISRSSENKSQIMTIANNLKNDLSEKLMDLNLIDEKSPMKLRGPDLRNSFENFQYWSFFLEIQFEKVVETKKAKKTNSKLDLK